MLLVVDPVVVVFVMVFVVVIVSVAAVCTIVVDFFKVTAIVAAIDPHKRREIMEIKIRNKLQKL